MRLSLLAIAVAAVLAACSPAPVQAPVADAKPVIEITEAFLSEPAGGNTVTGAGMIIRVEGAPVTLIGATSEVAETVEIHEMSHEGGMMKMQKIDAIEIKPGTALEMTHGSDHHLMLFDVDLNRFTGESADILLTFRDASGAEQTLRAEAAIMPPGG
jgi:periplasmic copper chaperone A